MYQTWGAYAARVGLDETATAEEVAVEAGLVIAPGSTSEIELRGSVLCYPEGTPERWLRAAVAAYLANGGPGRQSAVIETS
jgi:hypothetical protein